MTKLNTNRYNCIMVMPVFLLKFRVKNKLAPASSLLFSLVLIDSLERVTSLSSHCLQCSFHCAHSLCSPAYFRPPFACSQTRSCEFASLKIGADFQFGAGNENRTRIKSLGSSRSTIELYPHRMGNLLHHLKIIINQNFIKLTGEKYILSGCSILLICACCSAQIFQITDNCFCRRFRFF